jgi:hypothetical protein
MRTAFSCRAALQRREKEIVVLKLVKSIIPAVSSVALCCRKVPTFVRPRNPYRLQLGVTGVEINMSGQKKLGERTSPNPNRTACPFVRKLKMLEFIILI